MSITVEFGSKAAADQYRDDYEEYTRLDREIEDVVESKREAEGAAAAINAIRRDHGQEPMEFERLEELSDRLEGVGDVAHDAEGHVELMERFS